jgi:hypothetical protein
LGWDTFSFNLVGRGGDDDGKFYPFVHVVLLPFTLYKKKTNIEREITSSKEIMIKIWLIGEHNAVRLARKKS